MKNKKVVKRFGLDFRITVTLFVIQLIMFSVLFLLINNSVTSSMYQNAVGNLEATARSSAGTIGYYMQSSGDSSGIAEELKSLPLDGFDDAEYSLVDAGTGEYVFSPDSGKINTVADEQYVRDIISALGSGNSSGTVNYLDGGAYLVRKQFRTYGGGSFAPDKDDHLLYCRHGVPDGVGVPCGT